MGELSCGILYLEDGGDVVCVCHKLKTSSFQNPQEFIYCDIPQEGSSLVWVEVPSVAVTILLISNLWISLTIGGSTPSSVKDCVIARF